MGNYDDILHMPRPEPRSHKRMPMENRAAQFSPFAALTGYDAAIEESARQTEDKVDLDESEKVLLGERLHLLAEYTAERPIVQIRYFEPDTRKSGGAYYNIERAVKRVDTYERRLIFTDGTAISMDQIMEINGEIFACFDAGY